MRYTYCMLFECDTCGATAMVPQPESVRGLRRDPKPVGWGLDNVSILPNDVSVRVRLDDICSDCMQLPLTTLIKMAKDKVTVNDQ